MKRRSSAFTLLELLLASVIMSVLIGVSYSVYYGVMKLREKTTRAVEDELPRSYALLRTFKEDVSDMVASTGILCGAITGEKIENAGYRQDSLVFYTSTGVVNDSDPWGDVQKVEYSLLEPEKSPSEEALEKSEKEEGMILVRKVTRNLLPSVEEEPPQEYLLRNVQSLTFSYYDGDSWLESWDSTAQSNKPPRAIKVRIEFVQPDGNTTDQPALEMICEIFVQPATTNETTNANPS